MKNILEFFEKSVNNYPEKIAVTDGTNSMTYLELYNKAVAIGTKISESGKTNVPYLVYIEKSPDCLAAMLGIVYSGNFYTVIDTQMPVSRLLNICSSLNPKGIITNEPQPKLEALNIVKDIILINECSETNKSVINKIRNEMTDTDLLYTLFTSGSTGLPKGCAITHKNVISYIDWVISTFNFDKDTVFGSQTPFYFSMSVTDVFSSLFCGATIVLVPKMLFMFPTTLLDFLNKHKINTIYWVPSALNIVANMKALDMVEVPTLNKILFAGEVMPTYQLNIWMKHFPDALFANLFGPTETTDICTYYVVDKPLDPNKTVPIGKHCDNCNIIIINENGKKAAKGEEGEMYVRSSFVAPGYYNNEEKTKEVFVQNPLNTAYPEIVYKTGDLVKFNENGDLIYLGRKDHQIKHMGYRIELGEIEAASNSIENILISCCIFDQDEDCIILIYQGDNIKKDVVLQQITDKVPNYMLPQLIIQIDQMPLNSNGKIDRKYLQNNYKDLL